MIHLLYPILLSTLSLTLCGLIAFVLLRVTRCRSPLCHRIVWCVVLLTGVLWFRLPVDVPVRTSDSGLQASGDRIQEPEMVVQETVAVSETKAGMERSAMTESMAFTPPPKSEHEALASGKTPTGHSAALCFQSNQSRDGNGAVVAGDALLPIRPLVDTRGSDYFAPIIFTLWLTGVVTFLTLQIAGYLRTLRRLRDAVPPMPDQAVEWEALRKSLGIAPERLQLLIAQDIGPGLVKLGARRDAVIVPHDLWADASPTIRRGILRHEIAHYLHRDLAKSCLLRLIATLHWFNPMAHFAVRRFDEAAEWRCDAEAFGQDEQGTQDFAATLLLFRDTTPTTAIYRRAFCGDNVMERTNRLTEHHQGKRDSTMKKIVITLCVVLPAILGLVRPNLVAVVVADKVAADLRAAESSQEIKAGMERSAMTEPTAFTPSSAQEPDEPYIELSIVIAEVNKGFAEKWLSQLPLGNSITEYERVQASATFSALLNKRMELIVLAQGVTGHDSPQTRRLKESIAFLENRLEEIKKQEFGKSAEAQRIFLQIQLSTTYTALLNKQMELIVVMESVTGPDSPQARHLSKTIAFLTKTLEELKKQDQEAAINSLINSIPRDEATHFVFSASKDSVKVLFDTLERERKTRILSRPSVRMLDNQLAVISTGTEDDNEENKIFFGILPRINEDKIYVSIGHGVKKAGDHASRNQEAVVSPKEFALDWSVKEDVTTVVVGVKICSDGGEIEKELLLCITPGIVQPKEK